jgi:hypothetical protein
MKCLFEAGTSDYMAHYPGIKKLEEYWTCCNLISER